jgi:hypothetical protein
VSAQHPEKLRELIELWWTQAGAMSVLPLGAREWTLTADVCVTGPVNGVVYARGSHNVGHSFFV